MERIRRQVEEETQRDLKRYKELLDLREKEVDNLRSEQQRLRDSVEEVSGQNENLERENRSLKANRTILRESVPFKNSYEKSQNGSDLTTALLEQLSLSRR